jgi:hypothetical protein
MKIDLTLRSIHQALTRLMDAGTSRRREQARENGVFQQPPDPQAQAFV